MRFQQLKDWLVYFLVRVVICVIQALSLESCQTFARWVAVLACDVLRIRYPVSDENLRHVYSDLDPRQRRRVIRRMWEHLLLMVVEVAHSRRKLHEASYQRYVHFQDKPLLVRYLLNPRPIVLVTGHFGNFEVAGYVLGMFGFPTFTIARRLDNPYLDRFVNKFRGCTGQHILPKQGCAPQVDAILQDGGTLALLGDQHAGSKGLWIDFLGRPASCHKAVALFALASGAPLIVCYVRRLARPLLFEVGVTGVADPQTWSPELAGVKPLTQWYNERLEDMIRLAPEQYWWLHRRWKTKPPRARRRKRLPPAEQAA